MTLSDLKITIKAILASSKMSLTPQDLLRDFKEIEGYDFPHQKLGFSDFLQCLMSQDMSDTVQVHNKKGVQVIIPVVSEKSKHIDLLVKKQKSKSARSRPSQKPDKVQQIVDMSTNLKTATTKHFPTYRKSNIKNQVQIMSPSRMYAFFQHTKEERYKEICRNIKDEINDFELLKSGKLEFKCLICNVIVPSKKVEKHTVDDVHKQKKIKNIKDVLENHRRKKSTDCHRSCHFKSKSSVSDNLKTADTATFVIISNIKNQVQTTSSSCNFSFPDRLQEERYKDICRNIKDEINDFELLKSKKLEFQCALCNIIVPSKKIEKHIKGVNHIQKKIKNLKDARENYRLKKSTDCNRSCIFESKSATTMTFPANIKTNIKNQVQIMTPLRNFSFSARSKKKRYKEIRRNIKDEINDFERLKSKKLEFKCLICNVIIPSKKVEKHIMRMDHRQKKSKSIEDGCNHRCDVPLYKNECLCLNHFQCEFHKLRLQEFHATCNSLNPLNLQEPPPDPSPLQECLLSEMKREDSAVRTLAPENLFQDAAHFKALQFLSAAHKEQFRNLVKEVNYQINFFTIDERQQSEELTLTCKLCHVPVSFSDIKRHSEVQYHLLNLVSKCESKSILGVVGIDATDSMFLDFDEKSKDYVCTLCNIELSSNQDVWPIHFQSETHRVNVKEWQTLQTSTLEENAASG